VYWGRYVAHDNNRDGIGQYLKLTQAVTNTTLQWHPTVIHDLHETQAYLYVSTGTGPYNPELDPIVAHEWWMLADNDVRELTKRGVPGVWTYAYYDGWMPNYMFFIAHTHNAIGRFYEVQGYGPDPYTVRPAREAMSREWFRPTPPVPQMKWGPRKSVNIQQSALLFALYHVADHRAGSGPKGPLRRCCRHTESRRGSSLRSLGRGRCTARSCVGCLPTVRARSPTATIKLTCPCTSTKHPC
jgi:hypothetical protein